MLEIAPFRALHYDPAKVSFISRLVAPPYDLIDPDDADELRRRDPHNVIRLILGKEGPTGRRPEEYGQAAATFAEWQREGVLTAAQEPGVYVCEQAFTLDGTPYVRHGLICTILLEEFSSGQVLPHERTMEGPRADRLRLMEACGASLSQVFGVYSDPQGRADAATREMAQGAPFYEFADPDGVAYRVWRVTDARRIQAVASLLRVEVLFIADGHHRYEAALQYRALHRPANAPPGCAPEDFLPVFCVSVKNAGLRILPTHRLVRSPGAFDPGAFLHAVSARFTVVERRVTGPEELERAFRESIEPTDDIGCYLGRERFYVLSLKSQDMMDRALADRPPAWRRLPVTRLHYAILDPLLNIPAEGPAPAGSVEFTQHIAAVYWGVEAGRFGAGFLLPPIPAAIVETVARARHRMPSKSTFFYPKIATGLAFYQFALNRGLAAARRS